MNILYCPNCGVELEIGLKSCPLCNTDISTALEKKTSVSKHTHADKNTLAQEQSATRKGKLAFEIISMSILSSVIVTIAVDVIINRRITWSEFPVAVCLVIFSYVSLLAFWNQRLFYVVAGGLVTSSMMLFALDASTGGVYWSVGLGIPILFCLNLITLGYILVYKYSRYKSINQIAYGLICVTLFCLSIEAIWQLFRYNELRLFWSLIVSATLLPVSAVLIYIHHRLKKGNVLEKTFHL